MRKVMMAGTEPMYSSVGNVCFANCAQYFLCRTVNKKNSIDIAI